MNPVIPLFPHAGAQFFEVGLGQEAYRVLPAYRDADGLFLTEWVPDEADLKRLNAGGRIRLWVLAGGGPFPPLLMEASGPCPPCESSSTAPSTS